MHRAFTFTVLAALVAPALVAGASHPYFMGWTSTGALVDYQLNAVEAEISFHACRGPTWVTVTAYYPDRTVVDRFPAYFDFVNKLEQCPNYVPDGPVHLWNDDLDTDLTGAVEGYHLAATMQLAGTYKGTPAAFLIVSA